MSATSEFADRVAPTAVRRVVPGGNGIYDADEWSRIAGRRIGPLAQGLRARSRIRTKSGERARRVHKPSPPDLVDSVRRKFGVHQRLNGEPRAKRDTDRESSSGMAGRRQMAGKTG